MAQGGESYLPQGGEFHLPFPGAIQIAIFDHIEPPGAPPVGRKEILMSNSTNYLLDDVAIKYLSYLPYRFRNAIKTFKKMKVISKIVIYIDSILIGVCIFLLQDLLLQKIGFNGLLINSDYITEKRLQIILFSFTIAAIFLMGYYYVLYRMHLSKKEIDCTNLIINGIYENNYEQIYYNGLQLFALCANDQTLSQKTGKLLAIIILKLFGKEYDGMIQDVEEILAYFEMFDIDSSLLDYTKEVFKS
jgi:hypothetical protein